MTNAEICVIFLAGCIVVLLYLLIKNINSNSVIKDLINDNVKLKRENDDLNLKILNSKNKKILDKWRTGASCIHSMDLVNNKGTDTEVCFIASYTSEIIEISETKLKIAPISVITNVSSQNTPSTLAGILAYGNGLWINKYDAELILDNAQNRISKIHDILSNDE